MVQTKNITNLRKQLEEKTQELTKLGEIEKTLPELINTTNVLRTNEHLTKVSKTKTKLLETYEQYTKELESVINSMIEIQVQLKKRLKVGRKNVRKTVRKTLKRKSSRKKPIKNKSKKTQKKKRR